MTKKNRDLNLLVQYLDKEHRSRSIAEEPHVVKQFLPRAMSIAKESGLLYYFSQALADRGVEFSEEFRYEIAKDKRRLLMFKKTLTVLKRIFEDANLDLMFIKLYRGVPYVPRDIDILVRGGQFPQLTLAMRRAGFTVRSFQGVENECRKEGLLKIDLYQDFRYMSVRFMDQEFLWKNPRNVNIFDVECSIPSLAADIVSLSIHDLLGHRYLSFLDFLYADKLVNGDLVDLDKALEQPKKYHWENAFCYFASLIKELHAMLYSGSSDVSFPFRFSAKRLLTAFGSFTRQEVSEQRKLMFILSTLADSALFHYTLFSRSTSTELSDGVRSNLLIPLHKMKHWVGDSKLSG